MWGGIAILYRMLRRHPNGRYVLAEKIVAPYSELIENIVEYLRDRLHRLVWTEYGNRLHSIGQSIYAIDSIRVRMGQMPINSIGGGGCVRRCTANAANILDDLAIEIWSKHRDALRAIGMRKPASSVAIDFLIYKAVENGSLKVEKPLTPGNNMYLAVMI